MKALLKKTTLFLLTITLPYSLWAATACPNSSTANCTYDVTAQELANRISGVGITITNPVITHGAGEQVGYFSNGIDGANLEIDKGIILTCMNVQESFTTNSSWRTSIQESGSYTDDDLVAIDSRAIYNPVIFEFDVTLDENTRLLLVDYQFASDEYNEYVGSIYNDAFGFFISGGDLNQTYNIARVVDNQTYVTIDNIDNYDTVTLNNVNNGTAGQNGTQDNVNANNTAYYIDNDQNNQGGTSPINVEYDGLTHTLHATLDNLTPGETYHFKMAIADTGDAQWDTGVFVNKISGLREPSICYDYAYKQNGIYLTEGYDQTKGPYISGDVVANETDLPINVAMYFQNTKESEIVATNIHLDVLDINTSQATYKRESTYVTETNSLVPKKIDDVDLNVSDSYIHNIPVTSFDSLEYFYTYFSLNPTETSLELPIVARITYDLTIPLSETQSITITRSSLIDSEIPICGSGDSSYDPVYGIFNVIENGLFTNNNSYYYNLNTQITNRDANLSVVSIDDNETTNPDLHTLSSITTVVAVDMLDLKSFHYTSASCSEAGNAISPKTWVLFNNTSITPLIPDNNDFYKTARENVAFRISYNYNGDDNEVVQLEPITQGGETRYNVLNFSDVVKNGECAVDIANGTDTVAQWCSNAGTSFNSAMTVSELKVCMECVYGLSTKLLCARDNFSIRPESFLMHLDDQDQENIGVKQRLTTNYSGVTSPTNQRLHLASGYNYNLEVNATDHLGNNSSMGYNIHINNVPGTSSGYVWNPIDTTLDPLKCNDTFDHNFTIKIFNGTAELNTSLSQVGDYTLKIEDTSWTKIDSIQQSHHNGSYFLTGSDCVLNSATTASINDYDANNGCNISSNHTNPDNNIKYNDYNVTFHPYKLNVSNTFTLGKADTSPSTTFKPFIYMANILGVDENVSVHLNTTVTPVGRNGNSLSNFVDGCFAKPLNFTINRTATAQDGIATTPIYDYRVHNKDINGSIISAQNIDQHVAAHNLTENPKFTTTSAFFQKDQLGTIQLRTNINYYREANRTANPQKVVYNMILADDNTTLFSADLITNKTADGNVSINQQILHYYGRTIAPKIKVICNSNTCRTGMSATNDNNIKEIISYAIFCDTNCNNTIIPLGAGHVGTAKWWENTNHDKNSTIGTDGIIGLISEEINSTKVTLISDTMDTPNFRREAVVQYSGALPYEAKMKMLSSPWLIYDENNISAVYNKFTIQFVGNGGWNGKYEDNTTTKTNYSPVTNRRIMW